MTDSSMTFGLISDGNNGKKTYMINLVPKDGQSKVIKIKANGIEELRKKILQDYGHISTQTFAHVYEVVPKSNKRKRIGTLSNNQRGPVWAHDGGMKFYRITPSGTLTVLRRKKSDLPCDEYTSLGMPIYKIWYNGISRSYDVLARKFNGEWAYGHDYDRIDGMWRGGKYDYDIDNLYRRVGGTPSKVVVNNRRGPTGRF